MYKAEFLTVQSNYGKMFLMLLSLFVLSMTLLPTGNFFGVNVKSIVVIWLSAVIFLHMVRGGKWPLDLLIALNGYVSFLMIYAVLSLFNDFSAGTVLSAANLYFATFFVPWVLILTVRLRLVSIYTLTNLYLSAAIIFSLLKVTLFVLIFNGLVDLALLLQWMDGFFGYSPITHDYGWIIRINMPSDFILLPALVLLSNVKALNIQGVYFNSAMARGIFIVLILFAAFLTMSRFYIVYLCITILVSMGLYVRHCISYKLIILMVAYVVMAFVAIVVFLDPIASFIDLRYTGENASQSDSVRQYLWPMFLNLISESPVIGHGLGSYIIGEPYYENMPWNYVLFWLSSVQQFGLLGLFVILVYAAAPVYGLVKAVLNGDGSLVVLGLLFLYAIWLSAGLFSSYLLSSQAGLSYFGFYLISFLYYQLKKRHKSMSGYKVYANKT